MKNNLPSVVMKISEAIYELPFFSFIAEHVFVPIFGHFFALAAFCRKFTVVNTAPGDAQPVDNRADSQNMPPSRSRRGKSTIAPNNFYRWSRQFAAQREAVHSGAVYVPNNSNQYTI